MRVFNKPPRRPPSVHTYPVRNPSEAQTPSTSNSCPRRAVSLSNPNLHMHGQTIIFHTVPNPLSTTAHSRARTPAPRIDPGMSAGACIVLHPPFHCAHSAPSVTTLAHLNETRPPHTLARAVHFTARSSPRRNCRPCHVRRLARLR